MDKQILKKIAAEKAVEFIESGMVVGLGTGSTAVFAVRKIGELLQSGELKNIVGIPSSTATEKEAMRNNVQLTTFDKTQYINITIDGADEVDTELNLIKGGGGALLREKILAQASNKNIIIVDESKLSAKLGTKWALPVEVIKFAAQVEKKYLESIGASVRLRIDEYGRTFITDEGNWILDADFGKIYNPTKLAMDLEARAGIVEHGLFIGTTFKVIAASNSGIKIISK